MLFPGDDKIIDLLEIDVFLACKNIMEDPTYLVLVDVYYTLNYYHEKKGKIIICCLSILYIWLVNHKLDSSCEMQCPIDDFKIVM